MEIKHDGHPIIKKDDKTGVVLVKHNPSVIENAIRIKNKDAKEKQRIDNIEKDVKDIKSMLIELLKK